MTDVIKPKITVGMPALENAGNRPAPVDNVAHHSPCLPCKNKIIGFLLSASYSLFIFFRWYTYTVNCILLNRQILNTASVTRKGYPLTRSPVWTVINFHVLLAQHQGSATAWKMEKFISTCKNCWKINGRQRICPAGLHPRTISRK